MTAKHAISGINTLSEDAAVDVLGELFEHSPWIVRETWRRGPFESVEALHAAMCATLEDAEEARQLDLIRAHPDLVGKAARSGTLTRESTAEQRAADLEPDDLSVEEVETFQRLNREYRERFGFPLVICARENRKASILAGFASRMGHNRDTERLAAMAEIKRIAWYRLTDLVDNDVNTGDE
jgi:2-oxo-4-hydroxy-4-carboxy-5-ureidoimidazoline decarboxylase